MNAIDWQFVGLVVWGIGNCVATAWYIGFIKRWLDSAVEKPNYPENDYD